MSGSFQTDCVMLVEMNLSIQIEIVNGIFHLLG